MKNILIEYWRSDNITVNLGDYLIEALLVKLGFKVNCYSRELKEGSIRRYERCLFGVGTMLDVYWFDYVALHKDIWGCGYGGDNRLLGSDFLNEASFHAVRGHNTRDSLGLPPDIPLGDPGLLLPFVWPFKSRTKNVVSYIPHFESRDDLLRDTLGRVGADRYVDICCLRDEFTDRVRAIAESQFVLTTSLHGAIIAQAYGVPWALCCPPGSRHNMPTKWMDWFDYLGIDLKFCSDLAEARSWWEHIGHLGKVGDLNSLVKAFPMGSLAI